MALAIIVIIIEAFVLYAVMLILYTSLPTGKGQDDMGTVDTSPRRELEKTRALEGGK